jgi:hypothetical protein
MAGGVISSRQPGGVEMACDRCGRDLTEAEVAKHWPVTVDAEELCPDCYGEEAYCPRGHLLPGDTDSSECAECAAGEEYEAVRYAADGHAGEPGDGAVLARGSLRECRDAIAHALLPGTQYAAGHPMVDLAWDGTDSDVEAYHESDAEGCGGWAIRPAR